MPATRDSQFAEIGLDALPMWSAGGGPLYRSLAAALREAIQRGQLVSGQRLPPERDLARRLQVSRTTVVAAYELLRQEDLVQRRQGSGTVVRYTAPSAARAELPNEPPSRNALFRRLTDGPDETIDLVGAYLLSPHGLPPAALEGLDTELADLSQHPGYAPLGHPPLRRTIAEYLSRRGVPTAPEQVLVTNGAQQAIYLAARVLLQPGDTVVVENPTYPGALDAFNAAGARLAWVSTGPSGADVDSLAGLVSRQSPRLIYVIATYQNPVGGVLPAVQRRRLAQLVQAHNVLLIDDECLAGLRLAHDEPPPPIASFAPDAPILTVGSVSKLGWGGLRVGWVRAPEAIISRLGRSKAVVDLGASVPSQVVAMRLLQSLEELLAYRVALLAERFEYVSALLAELLPSWSWQRPQGGLCLWIRLPSGTAADFAQVALRHGVSVVPGPVASADGSFADYLRLPFGHQPAALEAGLRRLANAWAAYQPMDGSSRQTLAVIV